MFDHVYSERLYCVVFRRQVGLDHICFARLILIVHGERFRYDVSVNLIGSVVVEHSHAFQFSTV